MLLFSHASLLVQAYHVAYPPWLKSIQFSYSLEVGLCSLVHGSCQTHFCCCLFVVHLDSLGSTPQAELMESTIITLNDDNIWMMAYTVYTMIEQTYSIVAKRTTFLNYVADVMAASLV